MQNNSPELCNLDSCCCYLSKMAAASPNNLEAEFKVLRPPRSDSLSLLMYNDLIKVHFFVYVTRWPFTLKIWKVM